MGGHQHEDELQKDVLVIDGEAKKTSGYNAPPKEEHGLDNSPFWSLVDLKHQGVEFLFSGLLFQDWEFPQDDTQQEHRDHDRHHKERVREERGNLSCRWWSVSLHDFEDREERKVEVGQHEEPDVGVEFELRQHATRPLSESACLAGDRHYEEDKVGQEDYSKKDQDVDERLNQFCNVEPVVLIVDVKVVSNEALEQRACVEQD